MSKINQCFICFLNMHCLKNFFCRWWLAEIYRINFIFCQNWHHYYFRNVGCAIFFLCKGYLTWQGHGSKTTWLKSKHALQLKTYSDNDNQDQVYFIFFIAGYSKTILVSVQHHGNLILIGRGNIYGHNTIETELTFHEEENFIVIFISTWWQKDLFPSEYLMHV